MAIGITQRAVNELLSIAKSNDLPDTWGVRITSDNAKPVESRYGLQLENEPGPGDRIASEGGITVFCERKTFLLLGEVEVDHRPDQNTFVVLV